MIKLLKWIKITSKKFFKNNVYNLANNHDFTLTIKLIIKEDCTHKLTDYCQDLFIYQIYCL